MEMTFQDLRTADSVESEHGLRAFGWAELCARLGAAQDLRRVMAGGANGVSATGAGAFHRPSAQLLARQPHKDEGAVNPTSSADGKAALGTTQGEPQLRQDRAEFETTK